MTELEDLGCLCALGAWTAIGDRMKTPSENMNTLKVLKLAQCITLISILVLIVMYYRLGYVFEILKTMILLSFIFALNIRNKVKRRISYRELRNSICMMLIMVWVFLLLDIYRTVERLYGQHPGFLDVIAVGAFGSWILFMILSGEWKEVVYPTVRYLKLISLLCREWISRRTKWTKYLG